MKDKIITVFFLLFLFGLGISSIFLPDEEKSLVERRNLITIKDLKKDFIANYDNYVNDQLPFRTIFLKLNQIWNRKILQNFEHNDVYESNGYFIEKQYPLDEKSKNNFIQIINEINQKYLQNNNSYVAIIPDKSFFLDDSFLTIDYSKLYQELQKEIEVPWLNLSSSFDLEDYFRTDIHLKQNAYFKVMEVLREAFQLSDVPTTYHFQTIHDFKGASFYKVPGGIPEELVFLESKVTKHAIVKHLEYPYSLVYELEKQHTSDMYNIFLSGPSSVIEITNPFSENSKELILFRDSFASSLAPLLLPYYHKITLIDLRYIPMDYVADIIDFKNSDVLFLYSTLIVNHSFLLKA